MTLVDTLRAIGAALGLIGALILAPGAVRNLWAESIRPAVNSSLSKLKLPGRHQPEARNAVVNLSGGGVLSVSAVGTPGVSVSDGTVEQELSILQQRMKRVEEQIGRESQEIRSELDELRNSLTEVHGDLQQELTNLGADLDALDQRAVRINSAALPIIACAFLLGGFPEPWVDPWTFAVLLVSTFAFCGPAALRAIRVTRRINHGSR